MLTPWLDVAVRQAWQGVAEVAGIEHHPQILKYFKATSFHATADEVPWCAAFACWCLREAGFLHAHSARARHFLDVGDAIRYPAYGCIVVLARGGGRGPQPGPEVRDAPGHVGFFYGQIQLGEVLVLGGNQSDRITVQAFPSARVPGFRWPQLEMSAPSVRTT